MLGHRGISEGSGARDEVPVREPAMRWIEGFATVFVTGAAVMVVEILGTRIIGPVFGVSLFVWSALLVVTLSSLATGYYSGGVLVDRFPTPRLLGAVVAMAGVVLGLVPVSSRAVLRAAEAAGPRAGPLLSAAVLFAPCLCLLGMVGPVAVRLATTDVSATGRRVGAIYAVSTLGSVVGTLLTAFVLVPAFETDRIVVGVAASLALVGAASLAMRGHPAALASVLLPVLASMAAPAASLPEDIQIVDRAQSVYGLVEVIDDSKRNVRLLRVDHSVIGAEFLRDHTSGFSFIYLLESVRFLRPTAKDMLQIGLGTGALPSILARRGLTSDVVEIDPTVVRFARDYFGFRTPGAVYTEDARTFLTRTDRRYDVIVHDTFTGGTTPEHLLSLEVLERIHKLLRPAGVLALNFAGYQRGPPADAAYAVARTLRAVFRNVRTFRDRDPGDHPNDVSNLTYFASDGVLDFVVPEDAWFENDACRHVLRSFASWEVLKVVPDGPLVTDVHNPLARLQLPVAEAHFEAMNALLPVEVWLQ
jgi:predicted membrane-bound spermidine synthase